MSNSTTAPGREAIRQSMLTEMEERGNKRPYITDLVEQYMALWDIKQALQADIAKRGIVIAYNNGGGQTGTRRNDSIADLVKINAQMLGIFKALTDQPDNGDPFNMNL